MAYTAGTIVEDGMKLHADVDANIKTIILTDLSHYLDKLWSIYDIDQSAKTSTITLVSGTETVSMPTDLLRLVSITYDDPYRGFAPKELTPRMYNYWQSVYQNTSGTPPWGVWANYGDRTFNFQPVPSAAITGKVMYYPQFVDITTNTDLQFFPLLRLLELFAYMTYALYDGVEPKAMYMQEFKELESQLTFKYWSGGDAPIKDASWYLDPDISID